MLLGTITPCDYARDRHRDMLMWRNLWTILIFAFGTSVIIFLVLAIFFFLRQDWLPGGITTLATIVDSVGVKWVTDRRAEAVKEEEEAYKNVMDTCKDTKSADNLRIKQTVLGVFR